ncbi:MAG: hypothetical protein Ta2A_01010 [Treponemataceae bacterium]|nr:MAG: hypothetical protein Ta2A_01010 [Treponemataceae bacterium]
MGGKIFKQLLESLDKVADTIPDNRHGPNTKHSMRDAVKSAFGVFFFQFPSFLRYMTEMQNKRKKNNAKSMLGVKTLPSDAQVRNLLDNVNPETFASVFSQSLKVAIKCGVMKLYQVLDGGVLVAIDGLWYHSSEKIHCKHCLHQTKDGVTTYYHSALAAAIVKPHNSSVIPMMSELITNEDGTKKQDCELTAAKRWLSKRLEELKSLKATILGDDLYSHYPFCKQILDNGLSFIFTCRQDSHPWLAETIKHSFLDEQTREERKGKKRFLYTYRYLNNVPIRDDKKTLMVNYMELTITEKESGKQTYCSGWITNKPIDALNVQHLVDCARTRWKIENEHNNVLKNRGYNLEHNFGHGKEHAAEIFFLLNLLAFQFHTILAYCDIDFQKARASCSTRVAFFEAMRFCLRYAYHDSWQAFLIFLYTDGGLAEPG